MAGMVKISAGAIVVRRRTTQPATLHTLPCWQLGMERMDEQLRVALQQISDTEWHYDCDFRFWTCEGETADNVPAWRVTVETLSAGGEFYLLRENGVYVQEWADMVPLGKLVATARAMDAADKALSSYMREMHHA